MSSVPASPVTLNDAFSMPEETEPEIKAKVKSLEKLLGTDEIKYIESRRNYASKNTVWFSGKTISITVATFIASFLLVLLYVSPSNSSAPTGDDIFSPFIKSAEISIPIALGLSLLPIIVSIAINNLNLQKYNAEISASFSEMMIIRSKITLLEEKSFGLSLRPPSSSTPTS
ncbi:MAG TPA: hypothetical protein VKA09_10400 [Nitrososphaeraceae archaeon]|nr:hypothetical protein [Nitrososphaeraceae archaeon]